MVVILLLPGSVSAGSVKTWSPPFHGAFHRAVHVLTRGCLASRNDTTYSKPAFNSTTGQVRFFLESNTSGPVCPISHTYGAIETTFGFTTRNFTESAGLRHITVNWTFRWFADLTSSGGRSGSMSPASASYRFGMDGADLCDQTNGSCTVFPNSSAPGSGNSLGWSVNQTVYKSSYRAILSATISLTLNTTFVAHHVYRISTSVLGFVSSFSRHGSYHAQAYLIVEPILLGYGKLLAILIR